MKDYFKKYQQDIFTYDLERRTKNEARARAIKDISWEHAPKPVGGLDILEYGCGTGWGIRQFAQSGNRCVGVDVLEEAIALAEKLHGLVPGLRFQRIVDGTLPFPDKSFDFIFSSEVIEHVPVDQRPLFIKEFHRVMKDDGIGFFSYPNFWLTLEQHYHIPFHHWFQKIWRRQGLLYEDIPSRNKVRRLLSPHFELLDVTLDFLASDYALQFYPRPIVQLARWLARTPFAVQDYLLLRPRGGLTNQCPHANSNLDTTT